MGKSLVQSKTFWVGVLTIVAGLASLMAEQISSGATITVVGMMNILLRLATREPIDSVLPPKLLLAGAIALPASAMAADGDYMLTEDRPSFAVQIPTAEPTAPYREAYDRAMSSGRPLVVLVGASWCPPCRLAKARIAVVENGGVEYAYVDYDRERKQATQIMAGRRGVPHLAVWTRSRFSRWTVKHYVGVQSAAFYRQLFGAR